MIKLYNEEFNKKIDTFKSDLNYIKQKYRIQQLFFIDEMLSEYVFESEENQISLSKIREFVDIHFDEINFEFTLRANEFQNNEIKFIHDKEVFNLKRVCFSLDKDKGIILLSELPTLKSLQDMFVNALAVVWRINTKHILNFSHISI